VNSDPDPEHCSTLVITSLIFQVDWTKEVECFRTFMAETARFYRVATSEGASFSLTQHAEEKMTDDDDDWKYTIGTSPVCVTSTSSLYHCIGRSHRLNMELDLQSCSHWLRPRNSPPPPHLGSYMRVLLDRQDRRHLFVTHLDVPISLFARKYDSGLFILYATRSGSHPFPHAGSSSPNELRQEY
jgi:hypothetical protein